MTTTEQPTPNERQRAYKTEWQRRRRAQFAAERGYSHTADYGTGGLRAAVLERDGYACVKCRMTDAEHKAKWGRPITIDHIDKDRSHNTLDNLQTMCLKCHGRKDQTPRLRETRMPPMRLVVLYRRAIGHTFEAIASDLGVSVRCVWKWTKRWEAELP